MLLDITETTSSVLVCGNSDVCPISFSLLIYQYYFMLVFYGLPKVQNIFLEFDFHLLIRLSKLAATHRTAPMLRLI